jgi:hypothetical protein
MISARSEPPAVPPDTDPEADARFGAYVESLKANVDDPVHGDEYRALLAEDPEFHRALFDFAEALDREPVTLGVAGLVSALIMCLGAGAALLVVVWFLA